MLKKLKEMMGEEPTPMDQPGDQPGTKPGDQPGDQPGDGGPGGTSNDPSGKLNNGGGDGGERSLDKKGGISSSELPDEYQKLIDAYKQVDKSKENK